MGIAGNRVMETIMGEVEAQRGTKIGEALVAIVCAGLLIYGVQTRRAVFYLPYLVYAVRL
jgi:hypothetical protein